MSTAPDDLALAVALLRGERSPAKILRTRLERASAALPWVAERTHFEPQSERELIQTGLRRLWLWVCEQSASTVSNGWKDLAAGVLVAAPILGVSLPETAAVLAVEGITSRVAERTFSELCAVLYPSGPARVHIRFDAEDAKLTPGAARLDWSPPTTWHHAGRPSFLLDRPFEGRSCEAAFVAKWATALWPSHTRSIGPVGVIGEVDPNDGKIMPVQHLATKVRAFQRHLPGHLCFVPAEGLAKELSLITRPDEQPIDFSSIVPIATVADLLFKLRVPAEAENRVWEEVGARAGMVADWAGRAVPITKAVDLPIRIHSSTQQPPPPPTEGRRYRGIPRRPIFDELIPLGSRKATESLETVVRLVMAEVIKHSKRHAGGHVTGLPGGGKSWLLRQMHYRLCAGDLRHFGPSVLVNARRVTPERSLSDVIHAELRTSTLHERPDRTRATLWLLLDGLDELEPHARAQVTLELREWEGPFFVATRSLPEALPGKVAVDMLPLNDKQSAALLAALGRPPGPTTPPAKEPWSPRHAPSSRPERFDSQSETNLIPELKTPHEQLRSTPFGCALLASCEAEQATTVSREALMRLVVKQSVSRAERERPEPELRRELRWFSDVGVRFVGAAAWSMLRERRARLMGKDVAYAFDHVPEAMKGFSEFDRAAQHVGFLQMVDTNIWEFTHKAFSEYCAADYLLHRTAHHSGALDELLASVGEPGVDEVAVFLALLLESPDGLLRALARNRNHPIASLMLACRIFAEVRNVSLPVLLDVLNRRLRLISWFSHRAQLLPFGGNFSNDVWRLLARWSETLRPHWQELTMGCHPQTLAWFRGDDFGDRKGVEFDRKMAARGTIHTTFMHEDLITFARARRAIAEDIHYLLRFDVPSKALALMSHVPAMLTSCSASDRNRFKRGLGRLIDSKDPFVRSGARTAWSEAATSQDLAKRVTWLGDRDLPAELIDAICSAASKGGAERAMEAILWYCLGHAPNPEDPLWRRIRGHLQAQDLEDAWELGWSSGFIGAVDHYDNGVFGLHRCGPLDTLYSGFIEDDIPHARFRALVSWWVGLQEREVASQAGYSELLKHVRNAAHLAIQDPLPALRFIGADVLLLELGSADPPPLPTNWRSGSESEQLQWLVMSSRQGRSIPFEQHLAAVVRNRPDVATARLEPPHLATGFLRWRIESLWNECLKTLLQRTRARSRQATVVTALASGHLLEAASPTLRSVFSVAALRELAKSDQPEIREWASTEGSRSGYRYPKSRRDVFRDFNEPADSEELDRLHGRSTESLYEKGIVAAIRVLQVSLADLEPLNLNRVDEDYETDGEIALLGPWERLIVKRLSRLREGVARRTSGSGALDDAMASIAACAASKECAGFDMEAVATVVRLGTRVHALTLVQQLLGVDHVAQHGVAEINRLPAIRWFLRSVGSVEVARRWGRLPEHALLVLPSICLEALVYDHGEWAESLSSSEWDAVVDRVIQQGAEQEQTRGAFLRAALWGTEYWSEAERQLQRLGGIRPMDLPILLEVLRKRPDSTPALAYLNHLGMGDKELCEIWAESQVPWWNSSMLDEHMKHPAAENGAGFK